MTAGRGTSTVVPDFSGVSKFDFKARGLGPRKNELLMGVLNGARLMSFDLLREEALQKADIVDVALTTRQEALQELCSEAASDLGSELKSAGLSAVGTLLLAWLVCATTYMAYVTSASGLSGIGIAFVVLPALAVGSCAALVLAALAHDCYESTKTNVKAILSGGYAGEDEARMAYVASAVWLFGRERIYLRAGSLGGNGYGSKDRWAPKIALVEYSDIKSLEVDPATGFISISDGLTEFVIEGGGVDVLKTGETIVRRARDAGNEILSMKLRGHRMDGVAATVTHALVSRFAQIHPGVHVEARNGIMDARLLVWMNRADEVPMAGRIASFEGIPVYYLVENKFVANKDDASKPAGRVLH